MWDNGQMPGQSIRFDALVFITIWTRKKQDFSVDFVMVYSGKVTGMQSNDETSDFASQLWFLKIIGTWAVSILPSVFFAVSNNSKNANE